MPTLVHTNESVSNTYNLTKIKKDGTKGEKICWCHPDYLDPQKNPDIVTRDITSAKHATEHSVTEAEAKRMGVHIENGNLSVKVAEKKKK